MCMRTVRKSLPKNEEINGKSYKTGGNKIYYILVRPIDTLHNPKLSGIRHSRRIRATLKRVRQKKSISHSSRATHNEMMNEMSEKFRNKTDIRQMRWEVAYFLKLSVPYDSAMLNSTRRTITTKVNAVRTSHSLALCLS